MTLLLAGLVVVRPATGDFNSPCNQIFKSDPEIEKNQFHTQRSYQGYLKVFQGFLEHEINSKKPLHIVDFGAGEGNFAEQVAMQTHHKVSMISYKVNRPLEEMPNLKIFKDQFFENIPDETLIRDFGKYDVIVDYWGVIAYSSDPGATLLRLKNLCSDDCRILLQHRGSKSSKISDLSNSKIKTKKGDLVTLTDWIWRQEGLEVTNHGGFFYIQFDKNKAFAPEKLEMIEYKSSEMVPGHFWGFKEEPRVPAARIFIEK